MAFMTPAELRYATSHEWARLDGDTATIGITDYAQDALGDVVYVELPDVGATFVAASVFGAVESVKAASDLYTPVGGEVVEVNGALFDTPELLNSDPYGTGWVVRVKLSGAMPELLDAAAYEALVEKVKH